MKKIAFILLILSVLASCSVEGDLTSDQQVNNPTPETPTSTPTPSSITYTGNFVGTSGHEVAGTTKVYLENTQYKISLENFSVTSGPDLKVYLSKTTTPTDFVNLGNLTTATLYSIPSGVDVSVYKYVLIYCQAYSVLFASAQLSQN